jgi:malate dehydrogenase
MKHTDIYQSPLVAELSLFDIVHAPGVAIDLSHIDTSTKVTGFLPEKDGLKKALTGADIVVIPAGKYPSSIF